MEIVHIRGIDEVIAGIDGLQTDSEVMKKNLKTILRKTLADARKIVARHTKSAVPIDPRDAYKAVRHTVYKKHLGGSIDIIGRRKASNLRYIGFQRTLRTGQRGGNRRPRSECTELLSSYYGRDRAFILRFLDAGTDGRYHKNLGPRAVKGGYRGSLRARNFFGPAATKALEDASQEYAELLHRLIAEVWQS